MLWEHEPHYSFFEFSQTFTSVSIVQQKHGVHVFYFFQKTPRREKGKKSLLTLLIKCKFSLLAPSLRQQRALVLSPSSYTNTIFNQSARVLSQDCFLNIHNNCRNLPVSDDEECRFVKTTGTTQIVHKSLSSYQDIHVVAWLLSGPFTPVSSARSLGTY